MIFEVADEHCSDDCTEWCSHPDHQMECVVDLTDIYGFDQYEPVARDVEPAGKVLWL